MSVFFDGVPPVGGVTNAVAASGGDAAPTNTAHAVVPEPGEQVRLTASVHTPFADNKCSECHESKFSQKMKGPLTSVCFECHDDFLKEAKFKHDPAGNGECLSCHTPHESAYKGLLIKAGSQVCFECHEQADMVKVAAHKRSTETDCVKCHNPHAGSDKFFLKPELLKLMAPPQPAKPPSQ